jgi:hypothetical protein
MVALAAKPKSNKYVGSTSIALKLAHALFPEIITKMTGGVMRSYFKTANPIQPTNGNLFNTVDYGMSTHGGWSIPGKPRRYQKYIAATGILTLAAATALLLMRRKT